MPITAHQTLDWTGQTIDFFRSRSATLGRPNALWSERSRHPAMQYPGTASPRPCRTLAGYFDDLLGGKFYVLVELTRLRNTSPTIGIASSRAVVGSGTLVTSPARVMLPVAFRA